MQWRTKTIGRLAGLPVLAVAMFAASAWLVWQYTEPASGAIAFLTGTTAFVLAWYLAGHLHNIEFFNVEELTGYLMLAGLAVLGVNLLPGLLPGVAAVDARPGMFAYILQGFGLFLVLLYFSLAIVLFRRLVFIRQGKWLSYLWKAAVGLFGTGLVLSLLIGHWPAIVWYVFSVPALALLAVFSVQLHWIALISFRSKILVLLLLGALNVVHFGLLYQLWNNAPAAGFAMALPDDPVILLIISFPVAYALTGFLALLFNLPIAPLIEKKAGELDSFMRLSRSAESAADSQHVLRTLFQATLENVRADAAWLLTPGEERKTERILLRKEIEENDIWRIWLSIYAKPGYTLQASNRYMYLKDFQKDQNLVKHDLDFRSMVVFPVRVKNQVRAELYLLKKIQAGFDEYEIDLAESLIAHASVSLLNNDLLNDAIRAERLKEDLEIGKHVQQRLLPGSFPFEDRVDMAANSLAAEQVGGDYYDFYRIDDHRLGLLIGDVSGKGTAAAFHVAKMKGIFQSLMLQHDGPRQFIVKANTAVSNSFDKGMFITVTYMEVDLEKRKIRYSRGGHCPVLYYRHKEKEASYLEDEGLGLGILRNGTFEKTISEKRMDYAPGDAICLFTDGLIEARHARSGEEFGYERLKQYFTDYARLPANEIVEKLMNRVEEFTGDKAPMDDISLLVLKPG